MIRDTGGKSESSRYKGSDIGRRGPSRDAFDGPIRGRSTRAHRTVTTPSSGFPVKESSDVPDAAKGPPGRPGPGRLSASEIDLIAEIGLKALVGSTKVPALLIPSGTGPITETKFNLAKLRKYEAVRYDENRIFLTEKHADLDHTKNSLATDWVQNYSDAAKDPDSGLPPSEKLHGPVYVVARDPITKRITKSTKQLKKLKHALEWKYPFRRTD